MAGLFGPADSAGAVAGLFFIAVNHLASAGWATVFRRIPESFTGWLPVGAFFMFIIVLFASSVYPWAIDGAADHDPILQAKSGYLNRGFFTIRLVIVFLIWFGVARTIKRLSQRQDEDSSEKLVDESRRASAISVILLIITFTIIVLIAAFTTGKGCVILLVIFP